MDHAQAACRTAELRAAIRSHDHAYYVAAAPTISDREYDRLYRELVDLESEWPDLIPPQSPTQRVSGAPLAGFRTCPHAVPMLSLGNTYSMEDLQQFHARVCRTAARADIAFLVEPKIDGVSISLRYEGGTLVQALTRGNGREGDDVTANIRTIRSVPLELRGAPPPVWEARGEVFMPCAEFTALNERRREVGESEFANPRNAAAGSLKLLDAAEVARRPLDVVFYAEGCIEGLEVRTQEELSACLDRFGLKTPGFAAPVQSFDELQQAVEELASRRSEFPYEIDGAVVKVNEFELRRLLGFTARAPSWAIAYKYAAAQATTVLREITVQVGRTGVLTPVAELEPIFLAGSTIRRATLHNADEIERKGIRVGDVVVVEKAGEVIPAVVEVLDAERPPGTAPFDLYTAVQGRCPSCGAPIGRDPDFVAWRCENLQCPAQNTRRIEHFAARNAMDLASLGGIVAEKLVETGLVREPLDLFGLDADSLARLNLGTVEAPRAFGEKNARKLVAALQRARAMPLSRWLFALGIPNVGETAAARIAAVHRDLDDVAESTILRELVQLLNRQDEAREVNPRSRKKPPADATERAQRQARLEELNSLIETAAGRLLELGLVRPRQGSGDRPVRFVTVDAGLVVATSVIDYFESEPGRAVVAHLAQRDIRPPGGRAEDGAGQVPAADGPLQGLTIVLTGTLAGMTRAAAAAAVRAGGGKVTAAVSGGTDYLVTGAEPGRSKVEAAARLGIAALDEEAFLGLLGEAGRGAAGEESEQEAADDLFGWGRRNDRAGSTQ